jgi:hypothetical protein
VSATKNDAELADQLRYWAFKFCGKGGQEDAASDVMTAAAAEIERLRTKTARMRAAIHLNTDLTAVRAVLKGQL